MTKSSRILLTACFILTLLAGCAHAEQTIDAPSMPAPESKGTETQTVHNVDELICAIAPGAVIHLADGTYDLSAAPSYGKRTDNPYVKWEDCYDGYELVIHDLDGLTITGSGTAVTSLVTQPRNAHVLSFEDCIDVKLAGFTAGHTMQAMTCSGNVIHIDQCENVQMEDLSLYGCGAVGVFAFKSGSITLASTEIYDCSSAGIQMFSCQDVSIADCPMHNIGKIIEGYNHGYTVFSFDSCSRATVSGCDIHDNSTQYILSSSGSESIRFRDNRITNNSAANAMMLLSKADVVIESGNTVENNLFARWYEHSWDSGETERAKDETGAEVFTDDPEPVHRTSGPAVSTPVIHGEQKQVKVATVDELLAAIGSDTQIILTGEFYDLSTAADYGKPGTGYYTWEDTYDGPALVIRCVENFSIVSEDGLAEGHTLSAVPRYTNVITFRDCRNIMTKGFTAGHTIEPGSCMGGVLSFEKCTDALVENCSLFGCGILGVSAEKADGLQVINSKIYECSYGGIMCLESKNITVGGCEFWELGGPTFQIFGCEGVSIDGQEIDRDYTGD